LTAPQIVANTAYPSNGSEGIALITTISIIFDKEIDEMTIPGSFIIEGPETDLVTGPYLTLKDDPLRPDDDDFLHSPNYKGVVQGSFTFERLDSSNSPSAIFDYTGGGEDFRTKVIFTPNKPLTASTEYKILLAGDEDLTDGLNTGITTRTVFDTLAGPILGTGRAELTGGYIGSIQDKFNIQIIETGKIGEAKFLWWKDSNPSLQFELTTSPKKQLLTNGVFVQFFTDGTSDVDDFIVNGTSNADWSAIVKEGESLVDNFIWSFSTGSGSITEIPDTVSSTLGLGDLATTQIVEGFKVIEITPDIRATNLDPVNLTTILIRFNKNIKLGQDLDSLIRVFADPVNGDPSIEANGNIAKTVTVNGDTITITLN
jgi:hypothetical protein